MNRKQQALIDHLKAQYPNDIVTIRGDDTPNGPIVFQGTVEQLEAYWSDQGE
jgi:hypothetical protein